MSQKIFRRRTSGSMLFLRAQELIMSYIADCRYDAREIEGALQQAFGPGTPMFNPVTSDTKVAITSTRASDALPCIFANYNVGERDQNRSRLYSCCTELIADVFRL